jgi:hypothetical protein
VYSYGISRRSSEYHKSIPSGSKPQRHTDISAFFFETAQEEFKNYPGMLYRLLDIERDPIEQGFGEHCYDLIIAGNVLHATASIDKTMAHVRKLLKPSGKLMMHEITRPDILRSGFIFGLLPRWWLSNEEYKKWGPALSTEMWNTVLTRQGFGGVEADLKEFESEECQELSILLSTAAMGTEHGVVERGFVTIVVDLTSPSQQKDAQALQNEYSKHANIDSNVLGIDEYTKHEVKKPGSLVFLLDVEKPILFDLPAATYLAIQQLLTTTEDVVWIRGGRGSKVQDPAWGMIE